MISTITTSTEVHIISPVYFLLFLVLVGFIYHLIRNREYKDTLLASIIIGFLFGLIFNTSFDLLKTLKGYLIFIILVIIGGFLAVSLKKLIKNNTIETPETPSKSYRKWWDKQGPRVQAIIVMGICLLSLILITSTYYPSNSVEEQVQLSLDTPLLNEITLEDIHNKGGMVLVMSNNTIEYIKRLFRAGFNH